ncbi:MAG: UPF0149 family protein [Nitrospirae bacterium]|nr:UPF0149 family protein [Nitrospirota bacterium]
MNRGRNRYTTTDMFTTKDKKNLMKLLSRVVDPVEAFNLEALHGFLFGLAITPELIKPSEWLPVAFGEEMMEFESEGEAEELMGHLFKICNILSDENHSERLFFPFDIGALKKGDIPRIRDWTYGLYQAITLRYEIWEFGDRAEETITEEEQEIVTSLGIIISVATPENIPEVFEKTGHDPEINDSDLKLEATLFALLPRAVSTVQAYAKTLGKEHLHPFTQSVASHTVRIGRNDPCPCGSGKKYKKCCGMN